MPYVAGRRHWLVVEVWSHGCDVWWEPRYVGRVVGVVGVPLGGL